MQQQRSLEIDFGENFWVVRFSTFATISEGEADIPTQGRDFRFDP
jgi:hypothetical protein